MWCLQVAFVTATNNYRKELQFRALRHDADGMVRVRVLRNGSDIPISVSGVVVGDVVHLETGDKVGPCCNTVVLRGTFGRVRTWYDGLYRLLVR